MPVNPANQGFPQGSPHAVNPQVIYPPQNQNNVGFFSNTVPGLFNLAKTAGMVKDMITGNPLEEAQVDQAKAVAEQQRAAAFESEQRNLNLALTAISKASAPQRQALADGYKQVLPEQYWKSLDAAATMTGREMAATGTFRPEAVNTQTFFGAQAPQHPQAQQAQTPQATPPPPGPAQQGLPPTPAGAQGSAPATAGPGKDNFTQQPQTVPDPRTAAQEAGAIPSNLGMDFPQPQTAVEGRADSAPAPNVPPGAGPESPVTQQIQGQLREYSGPSAEPFYRTPFGPVPTVQRPLIPPSQAATTPGASPNDVLPMAEAHANPAFNQAASTVMAEVAPAIQDRVRGIGLARVWDALDRNVEVNREDLIIAQMDAREASQYLYAASSKLGVMHPQAGDLLGIFKLAMFMTTKGQNWNTEKWGPLDEFLKRYQDDPTLLAAHLPGAMELSKNRLDLDKQIMTLQGIQTTARAGNYQAQLGYQGRVVTANATLMGKQLDADARNYWTEVQRQEWGLKREEGKADRLGTELNRRSEELSRVDTRIGELLTRTAASNTPDSFKQAVARSQAATTLYRAAVSELQAKDSRIAQLTSQLRSYPVSGEALAGTPADQMNTNLNTVMTALKEQQAARADLLERIDGYTDAQGVKHKGFRQMAAEAAQALDMDPTVQASNQGKDPNSLEAKEIVTQLKALQGERETLANAREALRDPNRIYGALTEASRNWTAAPPNFEQFKTYPYPGTNQPISSLIPENQLVDYYAHFVSEVKIFQEARRAGVQPDLAGDSESIMNRFAEDPNGYVTFTGWGKPGELSGNVTYLIREGYVKVLSYDKKTNRQKLGLTNKGRLWLRQQQGGNPGGRWGTGARAGVTPNTPGVTPPARLQGGFSTEDMPEEPEFSNPEDEMNYDDEAGI